MARAAFAYQEPRQIRVCTTVWSWQLNKAQRKSAEFSKSRFHFKMFSHPSQKLSWHVEAVEPRGLIILCIKGCFVYSEGGLQIVCFIQVTSANAINPLNS